MMDKESHIGGDTSEDHTHPRYTIGEVVKMTGVSKARLDDYDKKGLIQPARITKGRSQE